MYGDKQCESSTLSFDAFGSERLEWVLRHQFCRWISGGSRGGWGPVPPPFFLDFFLQRRSLLAKISIKRVRHLSQNSGTGYFRDSNFQKFLEGMPPNHLECSRLRRSLVPPPPLLKILDPPLWIEITDRRFEKERFVIRTYQTLSRENPSVNPRFKDEIYNRPLFLTNDYTNDVMKDLRGWYAI